MILLLVRPALPGEGTGEGSRRLLDFRPVFRNRPAMAFVLGYTGHMWELFALRSWLVAFLIRADAFAGGRGTIASANWLTTLIVLASTAASIYGAEVAARADRKRVIGRVMLLSVVAAAVTGFSTGLPLLIVATLCLLYHMVVMGDSAALTGGAVMSAAPGQRGATLAVHSILGFGGSFFGPLAVGGVLDLAGGEANRLAWGFAFLAMGAGSAAAFVAIRRL
jgi:MFS family permease